MERKTQLTGDDIDNILDEIEEKEQRVNNRKIIEHDANWKEIVQQLRNKNIIFIKSLITSRQININSIEPITGKTLLIFAVIIGDLALCQALCDFGADVKIKDKDNLDAFDYAMKYARYKITELIYYRQLSAMPGKFGTDLKNINIEINKKNTEADVIYQYRKPRDDMKDCGKEYWQDMIDFTTTAIQKQSQFNENMLYYSWYFVVKKCANDKTNPFEHALWKTMMSVYENILSDTSNKKGWRWLKRQFINSYIWYTPHPNNINATEQKEQKDNYNDGVMTMEQVVQTTLFYELLLRVRVEKKKKSDVLLGKDMDKMRVANVSDWNHLVAFAREAKNTRQDVCGCLIPKYAANDLAADRYPPNKHFNAQKHYDINVYLNELIFRGNLVDCMFQDQMKDITKQINEAIGTKVIYRAGQPKTLMASKVKVDNELATEAYPTSAKIIDINRCAVLCHTIKEMLDFIRILSNRIEHGQAGCIKEILQCTNGWSVYNPQFPRFTDMKFNVLVQSTNSGTIIAEIQFLLNLMATFNHTVDSKLYSVDGKFELVHNYGLIAKKMNKFLAFDDINIVFHGLVLQDDVHYFTDLWENIRGNLYNLVAYRICVHIIMSHGQIHAYLRDNYVELYRESILFYINNVMKLWFMVLEDVTQCGYDALQFVRRFMQLFDANLNVNDLNEATKVLRSFNMIFDLLNHNIYSFINESQNTIRTPQCVDMNGCNYHSLTDFKLVSDSFTGGELYAFGEADSGQLGIKEYESEKNNVKRICKKPNIVTEFSANDSHLLGMDSYSNHHLAMDVNHKVYSWGANDYGQLGDSKNYFAKTSKPIPNLLKSFAKYNVISVAVGQNHSLILTNDGNVWSFGDNRKGQLGNGNVSKKESDKNPTPKIIKKFSEAKEYVISISAGAKHSAAVSKTGKLFCWGANECGQCGANHELGKLMIVPYEVDINNEYKQRDSYTNNPFYALQSICGWKHTLLLSTSHTVLRFGKSFADDTCQWKATVISSLANKRVIQMSCAVIHSLFVTEDGELYSSGNGVLGTLGHGQNSVQSIPKRVEYFQQNNLKIVSCETGSRHSGVITSNGKLFMFGRNASNELALPYNSEQKMESEEDAHNNIPKQVGFFQNFTVGQMSFGQRHSHIVISDESDEKSESDAHYLKANQEERIWCPSFKMYIKNQKLFGKNDWILLAQKK